jgi:hypothetical protein
MPINFLFTCNHNISFICHFYLFPGKLFFREITSWLYFPAKFSREFTLSLYFHEYDKKPTERQIFSTQLKRKKMTCVGIEPTIFHWAMKLRWKLYIFVNIDQIYEINFRKNTNVCVGVGVVMGQSYLSNVWDVVIARKNSIIGAKV